MLNRVNHSALGIFDYTPVNCSITRSKMTLHKNMTYRTIDDLEECERIWEQHWPVKGIFDLWQARLCFHDGNLYPVQFFAVERNTVLKGFLPLTRGGRSSHFTLFPGERWPGKPLIGPNRIVADNIEVFHCLMESVPGSVGLRHLEWHPLVEDCKQVDKTDSGHIFYPGMYDFIFDHFWLGLPTKYREAVRSSIEKFESRKLSFRFNTIKDLVFVFEKSRENTSVPQDMFERFVSYLSEMGWLRIVTMLVGGRIAVVDVGSIFNNIFTLFVRGSDFEFANSGKILDFHHMKWACQQRLSAVEFMNLQMSRETERHLSKRPLYDVPGKILTQKRIKT